MDDGCHHAPPMLRPWWRHVSPERARKRSCRTCKLSWQNSTNLGGQPKSTDSLEGSLSLKVTAWKCTWKWMIGRKILSLNGPGPFSGAFAVSFREGSLFLNPLENKKYRNVKDNFGSREIGAEDRLEHLFRGVAAFQHTFLGMDALQGFCPSTPNCKWKGWVGLMGSLRHIKCLPETGLGKLFQSDLQNEKPPDSLITSWGSLIYWSFVHVPSANIEPEVFRRNPNAWLPCQGKLRFLDEEFRCAPNCQGRGETWWEVKTGLNET